MANFYGELVIRITSDTTGLKKGLNESAAATTAMGNTVGKNSRLAAQRMEHVGRQMQNIGRQMTQFVTLPVAAGFAVAGVAAFKYEDALIKIRNLTGLTAAETKAYGEAMLELGGRVGKTPLELADAFYFLASSGFKGKEAMDALEVAAKASAAGLGDVMATADVVSSAVNAYGHENLTAAHMVDVLMKTIEVGKAEPEALAASLGRIMPVAQGLGVSIEDLGGMIAGLTLTGLSSAEAVTALRGAMMALSAPTKMSLEAYKEMGLTYKQVSDRIRKNGLIETLQFLYEKVDGDRLALRKLIPNVRALNGVLGLLGPNYEKNLEVIDKVNNAHGKLNETFKATKTTNVQKLREAWAKLQAEFIKLGAIILPYFVQFAEWLVKIAQKFNGLSDGWKKWLLIAAGTAAVLGPVIMVLGTLINSLGLIRGVLAGLNIGTALGQLFGGGGVVAAVSTLGASLPPVAIGLGAIAAAAAGIYGITKLKDWLDGTTDRINKMRAAAEAVKGDTSIKDWADANLGGHLEEIGKNEFKFVTPDAIDENTDLLANWVKTNAAKAKVAAREAQQQLLIDVVTGQKAWVEQELRDLQGELDRVGTGSAKYDTVLTGAAAEAAKARLDAQMEALRATMPNIEALLKEQQERMEKMKLKDQVIVIRAKETDLKNKIAEVKKKLDALKGKPHTVKMMLREEALKQRLSDLRAGLGDLTGKTWNIKLQLRIQNLEDKVELAKRRLERLKSQGERAGGKSRYSPEISADITKLEEFVAESEQKIADMKEKAEATDPTLSVNIDPALTAIDIVNQRLDAMDGRTVTTTIFTNVVPSDNEGPTPHSGGLFSGPHSGYPATLHGTELVLPLDHPQLIPALLAKAGLTAEGMKRQRADVTPRRVAQPATRPVEVAASSGPAEVHYHSHMNLPQGIVVSDVERFSRTVQPYVERGTLLAQRRRERGRPGL